MSFDSGRNDTHSGGFCVSDECIHGFVDGLCATCNPKPVPETVSASRPAARSRVAAPPRATVRSLRAAARIPVGSVPADALLEQRIYHLTHLRQSGGHCRTGRPRRRHGSRPRAVTGRAACRARRDHVPRVRGPRHFRNFVPFFLSPGSGPLAEPARGSRSSPALVLRPGGRPVRLRLSGQYCVRSHRDRGIHICAR